MLLLIQLSLLLSLVKNILQAIQEQKNLIQLGITLARSEKYKYYLLNTFSISRRNAIACLVAS